MDSPSGVNVVFCINGFDFRELQKRMSELIFLLLLKAAERPANASLQKESAGEPNAGGVDVMIELLL